MRSLILDYLKSVGRAVWPGPALARRIGIGRELNREKVPSLWGVAGKAWFLPYLDTYTGETQTIRSAYRLMWKDPTVKAALLSKIFAVSSLELQVHPDGPGPLAKKVATFVNYAIRQAAGGVSRIVESILLGGLPEGHVLAEKVYRHYDDGEYRGQIGLQGLYDKDPETYRLETDEYRRITRVTPLRQSPATHYNPGAFLLWQHLPIYRNPLGMSDLRAAYRAYWIIDTVWKLRAIGLEKNINPLLKGVYQDVTDKPDLEAMLEQARSQTWLTVPEGVQVEAMELSQRGHSDFRDAILDLRHEVMLGITGAFLQALEGTQTGARSIGEVHESSAELLVWWLAESVAAALQQQIAPDLVAMNFAGAACPEIGLGGVNDASLLASVQVDAGLLDMGLALSKKERYKYYGRQEPEDEGDVLVRPTPPPSGSGGMAGLPFADPTPAKTTPPQPPASPSAAGDFPESAGRSRRAGDDVALAGPDGVQATALLRRSVRSGTAALGELAAAAVERLAAKGKGAMRASRLFTDDERQQFADTAAATIATAELLGRARIRERARLAKAGTLRFSDATPFAAFADAPIEPLMPLDALEYFRSLVPDLARTPATFGPRMERRAFALAVDADAVLLDKIKQSIAEAIADGLTPGAGGQAVQRILDDAGVSVRNPQYAEMVMRTNVMDAYNQGAMRELQEPDVAEAFPAWKFIGIADGRQRPSHAVHFGKYYPTSATFAEVRDSVAGKFDGFNCRCNFIPISRAELRELRDQGVALSKFAEVAAFCDCVAGAADRFCMIGPNAHKPGPCPGPEPTAATPDQAPAKAPATRGEMTAAKREGKGKDARVVLADGSPAPAHVKAAMIPPQWTNVQVSLDPKADVIATGRDAAGRSKTVYTDEFHMRNAAHKFARTQAGLKEAANLRRENLANRKDPALRDHADCTWLMQEQATRPGSDADTGAKVKAYGATTLRAEHVVESPDGVRLQFVGKEGVHHDHLIRNPELATMLVERKKSADQRNGRLFDTNYNEVAKYAKSLDSGRFTPKDFRTIRANELAVAEIAKNSVPPKTEKEYKARVKAVAEKVSSVLGNRPAQALESYIDPAVFSVWKVAA